MESQIKTLKEYKKDMEDYFVICIKRLIHDKGIDSFPMLYTIEVQELILSTFLDAIAYIDKNDIKRIPFEGEIKKYFWKRAKKIITKFEKDENIILYDTYGNKITQKNSLDAESLNKTSTILLVIFFFPIVFIFMLFKSLTKGK